MSLLPRIGIGRSAFSRCLPLISAVAFSGAYLSAPAFADCYGRNDRLEQAKIDDFNKNPRGLLSKLSTSAADQGAPSYSLADLTRVIRDLVASSPSTLGNVLALAPLSTVAQKRAIGTGLGQASLVCLTSDRNFAAEIQKQVLALKHAPGRASLEDSPRSLLILASFRVAQADDAVTDDNQPLIDAFNAVTGDVAIGAAGGGGGGSGGGAGGGGGHTAAITFGGSGSPSSTTPSGGTTATRVTTGSCPLPLRRAVSLEAQRLEPRRGRRSSRSSPGLQAEALPERRDGIRRPDASASGCPRAGRPSCAARRRMISHTLSKA